VSGTLVAGVAVNKPGGVLGGLDAPFVVTPGEWRHWRLAVRRLGTRTTTTILWIDGTEQARLQWSSTEFEPTGLRAGIGLISPGATATVRCDSVRVTERHAPPFPALTVPPPPGPGDRIERGRLLVAPNVLERDRAPGAFVVIGARGDPGATATLHVLDAGGRRVRTLSVALDAGGLAEVRYDGRDDRAAALRPGLYWVVARGGGVTGRTRFLVAGGGPR
jgi:hypothetical protein